MKRKWLALALGLSVFLSACGVQAELDITPLQAGFDSISEHELDEIINYLADPAMRGRRADTPESDEVADYLSGTLADAGFDPIDEDYAQEFCLRDVNEPLYERYREYFISNNWDFPECGENIVGIMPGAVHSDEYVVLVAHRDHVGYNPSRVEADHANEPDGRVLNPGADDNASGTAGVVEIAEAIGVLADEGTLFDRGVIVVFADAEEFGLWGSRYFAQNPPVPLEQIVSVINLDMIGRNAGEELRLIGAPTPADFEKQNPDLADIVLPLAEALGFTPYYPPNRGDTANVFERSDHFSFYEASPADNRIPVVFFSGGLHADYHRPTDTAEKINDAKVRDISRLALLVLWQISEMDEAPDFIEAP